MLWDELQGLKSKSFSCSMGKEEWKHLINLLKVLHGVSSLGEAGSLSITHEE